MLEMATSYLIVLKFMKFNYLVAEILHYAPILFKILLRVEIIYCYRSSWSGARTPTFRNIGAVSVFEMIYKIT